MTDTFSSQNPSLASLTAHNGAYSTWKGMSLGSTQGLVDVNSTTLGDCGGQAPIDIVYPGSLTGKDGAITIYNKQTVTECNGTVDGTNLYGLSECYQWQINDQSGDPLASALGVTETLTLVDSNVGGTTNSANVTANANGQFNDFYGLTSTSALPANACRYIRQDINVNGAHATPLQRNCIHYTKTGIQVTHIASQQACQTPTVSCPH